MWMLNAVAKAVAGTAGTVLLHSHFEIINGTSYVFDEAGGRYLSGATLTNTQSKFGSASLSFGGTSGTNFSVAPAGVLANWQLGNGDFTLEFWIRPGSLAAQQGVFTHGFSTSNQAYSVWLNTNGTLAINLFWSDATSTAFNTAGHAMVVGTWYHVAVVRSAGTVRVYVDGVQRASQAVSKTLASVTGSPQMFFSGMTTGTAGAFNNYFTGNLDEFRLTKGFCRYTENFTPATAAFPAPGGNDTFPATVQHRLRLDGNTFDEKGATWSAVGTPTYSSNFKFGNNSLNLNGSSQYLSTANNSTRHDVTTQDFCMEAWVYLTAYAAASSWRHIAAKRGSSATQRGWLELYTDDSGNLRAIGSFSSTTLDVVLVGTQVPLNTWCHVAFTRQGDVWRLFLDGALVASTTQVGSVFLNSGYPLLLGTRTTGDGFWQGQIDDFRFSVGAARYTTSFTPSAYPHPSV